MAEVVERGREVIEAEITALRSVADGLNDGFSAAVGLFYSCSGRVAVTGVGKAGLIGQKISATLASTGTPSYWMHAVEALHGDLGRIVREDVVLALSNSGETEIIRLIPPLKKLGIPIVSITGSPDSTLGDHSDIVIDIGRLTEACRYDLIPSCTTTAMLAVGDALALTLFDMRDLSKEDYAFFHPGGELGRRLIRVDDIMRSGSRCPRVTAASSVLGAVYVMGSEGSPGAVCVTDNEGRLVGFFTDGDLRRRLFTDPELDLKMSVSDVMTPHPRTVHPDDLAVEAYRCMRENRVDNLPVVEKGGKLVGLLDVQDWLDVERGIQNGKTRA